MQVHARKDTFESGAGACSGLVLLLAGCSDGSGARGSSAVDESAVRALVGELSELPGTAASTLRLVPVGEPGGQGLDLELLLPVEAWRAFEIDGAFTTHLPVPIWDPGQESRFGLEADGDVLNATRVQPRKLQETRQQSPAYGWHGELLFLMHDDAPQQTRIVQRVPSDFGGAAHGRLRLPGLGGRGSLFGTGLAWSTEAEFRPGDTLQLGVALEGPSAEAPPAGDVRVEVLIDGEPLTSKPFRPHHELDAVAWTIALPNDLAGKHRLEIRAQGVPALGALVDPRLVPAAPAPAAHPDVLLFLADTLRADNLQAYRDPATGYTFGPDALPAGLMPAVDALSRRSRLYRESWASSTWTLPSHGSLFSSLHPRQHTATLATKRLPGPIETVAETFSAAGYRTLAVTAGGFCSARFGLDQGFDLFEETADGFTRVLELVDEHRAQNDGRPLFLFVQTFRVHGPFKAEPATLTALDLDVEPRLSADELAKSLADDLDPDDPQSVWIERFPAELRRLEALYRGAVHEFDAEFGAWLAGLEAAGWFERGLLAFTSDHGNAFGENERLFHSSEAFEAQLRIPLLLFGPDITPGLDTTPTALIDLAPTLARYAGLEPPAAWIGADLLGPDRDGILWATSDVAFRHFGSVARLADGWKWMRTDATEQPAWYRLDQGVEAPAETPPDRAAPTPAELEKILSPRAEPEVFRRTADLDAQLRRLGYLDEEDSE